MSVPGLSWESLGDLGVGRPNLGATMRVEAYRLMLFSLRDVLDDQLGVERAKTVMYMAGHNAGRVFANKIGSDTADLAKNTTTLQETLLEMGIGVLRFEMTDMENGRLELTVSEDLDCSGVPDCGETLCVYDEGFISGTLEVFTGKRFDVTEVECWATGSRTCRFVAVAVDK